MTLDASGSAPRVESSARGLGVRRKDLAPCEQGLAHPNRGGMSVARALIDLPPHRVPQRLDYLIEGASGSNLDRVWVLGDGTFATGPLSLGLALRVTSATHGNIEPDQKRPFVEFEAHLAATATMWRVGEP